MKMNILSNGIRLRGQTVKLISINESKVGHDVSHVIYCIGQLL